MWQYVSNYLKLNRRKLSFDQRYNKRNRLQVFKYGKGRKKRASKPITATPEKDAIKAAAKAKQDKLKEKETKKRAKEERVRLGRGKM